ncbi:hypothetical protein GCM10010112_13960 [Actinoplanes lobatus]|uniref:Uncharacterized protein n=1 Tax=Actinoplanes lobatus TaxID=113568 RepID=A0ABQ4APG1_9ACTN|nr:hypothetical protein GCM10010112_13960 [Actinoplanes lobatus]GIE42907.1 hypothetical protein Alo02nite_58050 [Actinoplanes lobatus]
MYPAHTTPATRVNSRNRPDGSPTWPDVMVVAVRPPGRNRPASRAAAPYRDRARSARARATARPRFLIRAPARLPIR